MTNLDVMPPMTIDTLSHGASAVETMTLSRRTLDILKLCKAIQPGLLINAGSRISTVSHNKCTLLHATVKEKFPRPWAISSLQDTLGYLSEGTVLSFDDFDSVQLRNGRATARVPYGDPRTVFCPPKKTFKPLTFQERITLSATDVRLLNKWIRIAARSDIGFIVLDSTGTDRVASIRLCNGSNDREHEIQLELTNEQRLQRCWRFVLDSWNLYLLEEDYYVDLAPEGLCRFSNTVGDTTLYVSAEQKHSTVDNLPFKSA